MIIRARTLVPIQGQPISDGAVAIENERIVDVGAFAEVCSRQSGPVTDLGEQLLMPGLINLHCHLDYTAVRKAINAPTSFTHWIERLNALKRSFDDDDYLTAIASGFEELKRWGTTSVLNIESFPKLLDAMPTPPLRTWWFYELIDIRLPLTPEALKERLNVFCKQRDGWLGGYGVSPHAPYTASRRLFKDAAQTGLPLTTHIAESNEETLMFAEANGPLHTFLSAIGRPMDDCGRGSPLKHLCDLVEPSWIIAHLNELQEEDFEFLANVKPQIAHCPLSHRYFNHHSFPYERLHKLGLNISIATDSMASNQQLNLFAEMRTAQRANPWLHAEELVEAVTVNPASALGMEGQLGVLAKGAFADLIALPYRGKPTEVFEAIVGQREAVQWMMINGRIF